PYSKESPATRSAGTPTGPVRLAPCPQDEGASDGVAHSESQGGAMHSGHASRRWLCRLFAGAGMTILAATPAPAQVTATNGTYWPPAQCPVPGYRLPCESMPGWPPAITAPSTGAPG